MLTIIRVSLSEEVIPDSLNSSISLSNFSLFTPAVSKKLILSISLISAEVGMTKSMWADMEKGKKDPQLSTFLRIAEGLEVRAEDLLKELFENLSVDFSLIE